MRAAIALSMLAACGSRPTSGAAPAAPAAPVAAPQLDAYVTDAHGPIAGADVKLVALPDGRCPCGPAPEPADSGGYGNEMPECRCPEALASWQQRLASCEWPSRAMTSVATDARGHASLERSSGVTGIEVARNGGVRWLPWPGSSRAISLELAEAISPRVTITGDQHAQIHGAFLFDDGHCVPLDRRGDAWGPRAPIPKFETSGGTLVINAPGHATIVYSLFDQETIELDLHADRLATGTCEAGGTARLDNPFQHLVAKLDAKKQFTFAGALDMTSTVSCWEDAKTMSDEWEFSPQDGLLDGDTNVYGGTIGGSCVYVKVVDAGNRPLVGADISAMWNHGGGYSSGTGATTDSHGIACIEDLSAGMELSVNAPALLGGQCAGTASIKVGQRQLASSPLVVRLQIAKLPMARSRGRIVNAEGTPVAGAHVTVSGMEPKATPDCSESGGDSVTTAVDGTFALAALPRGKLTLDIQHEWYAQQELVIQNDGSPHDIVLQRGARWTGRILDPEGKPIEQCSLFLTLASQRLLTATCSKTGFEFGTLTPGDAKLSVRVEKHALGTFRTLKKTVHLEAGKALALDVAFPRGEHISGRVVDKRGNAIGNARLTALPKGISPYGNRFHDDEVMLETDAFGLFTFRHLRPGTWTIHGDRRSNRMTSMDLATGSKDVVFVVPDPPVRR